MKAMLVGALCLAGAGGALLVRPTPAPADTVVPTPGQLQVIKPGPGPTVLCPLKRTEVGIEVTGPVARVTVQQQFTNPSSSAIEAVYTFPLPADSAVDDMEMRIGARVIKGEIKRKEEARAIYDAARNAGQTASLLDQERPNIFTQSVTNIPPGAKVDITIRYLQTLKYEKGVYELAYPMVVGPRYNTPASTPEGDLRVPDASKITPPTQAPGVRAGHNIGLSVSIDAGVPIRALKSELHDVAINQVAATRAQVTLRKKDEIPNRDFVLRYEVGGHELQEGVLTYARPPAKPANGVQLVSGVNGYFTLILQPPAAPAPAAITPKEMVFVIDQTGSQQGAPIEKAKATMRHCIQNLNPGDTFQLIGFNTDVYPCFQSPVETNPETVKKALDYLAPLAGSGATDILKAATYALQMPDDPNRLRIICFMTDGYVGDDMRILDFVRNNRGRARMFPFGIGNSVNRFLIDGMAREGKGAAEFVLLNGDSEQIAKKFYDRVANPLLKDIEVDFGGLEVEDVYPKQIPDVFSSQPIVLKGRYTQAGVGDITIKGISGGQHWQKSIRVELPAADGQGQAIATLWARERIEDLMSQEWEGPLRSQPNVQIKTDIINTALEYRLMSQYTSFVAVEPRVVNVGGKPTKIEVPVEMPNGVTMGMGQGIEQEHLVRARFKVPASAGGMGGGGGRGAQVFYKQSVAFGANPAILGKPASSLASAPTAGPSLGLQLKEEERSKSLASNSLSDLKKDSEDKSRPKVDPLAKVEPSLLATANQSVKSRAAAAKLLVQVWLFNPPKDMAAKLKAAGIKLEATLVPGKLALVTVDAKSLSKLAAFDFVKWVERPKTR